MKLLRYGAAGAEKPGLLDAHGHIRDLSEHVSDIGPDTLAPQGLAALAGIDARDLPRVDPGVRLGPCVTGIGKIVAIGLNYTDHAAEAGMALPSEPIIFMKAVAASGPDDPIALPPGSQKTDWEVELGVVMGSRARHVSEAEALTHVAGYCLCNDVSERAFQLEGTGQWVKGKSYEGFAPVGPWLVTPDEIPDVQNLALWLEVNNERRQDGNTGKMVFGVASLIAYVSRFMTLHPGDLIETGTPAGVGMGHKPEPTYLSPGDVVRLGIEGLGEQRQEYLAASPELE